ncbi:uncharacterized protein LOC130990594 [Salvia miltiorrhiza]|uniref:uncharacterized protein LOC130990594 n=1 Tax=Salvia miltiorrhiza TaxID=226208 RepID=UPI0025ABCBDC|nr:uncharacterized protein LOC130990594 [Salvia miltiorrhiza]
MNCLLWNCRGLENQSTIRQLVWLVKQKRPDLVFLMETKLFMEEWNSILVSVGLENSFVVECDHLAVGRRGGLCLLWSENVDVHVKSSSPHHILAEINENGNPPWDFAGIYRWSNTSDHHKTWDLLRSLHSQVADKWVCGGDFNETMYHFENRGGNAKVDSRISAFREVAAFCEITDLGYSGEPYTWTNNQSGADNIMERLDRVFGNDAWMDFFPGFEVIHLLRKSSDHCPILLTLSKEVENIQPRPKPFRFEAMWLKDGRCKELCQQLWDSGSNTNIADDFNKKMAAMGHKLKIWERSVFGQVRKKCEKLREELAALQNYHRDPFTKERQ